MELNKVISKDDTVKNFHLRNIEPQLLQALKKRAAHEKMSLNTLILQLLKRELGLAETPSHALYNDLDSFAGTWNKAEANKLRQKIRGFEKIDKGH